ncbi:hypothetical protein D3C83_116850 [compost metagenome]
MPSQREGQVLGRDSRAVVLDLDAPHAAFFQRHGDGAGAGIEAVLEQLLQHRGRALDDLAGRDLAHEELGQEANGWHGGSI